MHPTMGGDTTPPSRVTLFYKISLSIKGLLGLFQLLGAFALWLLPNGAVAKAAHHIASREISHDSDDFIATHVLMWADKFALRLKIST